MTTSKRSSILTPSQTLVSREIEAIQRDVQGGEVFECQVADPVDRALIFRTARRLAAQGRQRCLEEAAHG